MFEMWKEGAERPPRECGYEWKPLGGTAAQTHIHTMTEIRTI